MALLEDLPADKLTPARLWSRMDAETRRLAAEALYDPEWDDRAGRIEANRAIAQALRYRPTAVQRLPLGKRVDYLSRAARPDDSLATSLLMALHLGRRRPMLCTFLDALEIPHEGGVIDPDYALDPVAEERLVPAVSELRGERPADEVELYLACLVAMDRDVWGGLDALMRRRED